MATESLYTSTSESVTDQTGYSPALTATDLGKIDDDPDSPDANWIDPPDNNTNVFVRFSMPTPTGNPTPGAGLQQIRIWVKKDPTAGTGTPTATIQIYETGQPDNTPFASGSANNVTSTTGELFTFDWNASGLANADGSGVEIKITGTKSGGSPSQRAGVSLGAVEWVVDYTLSAGGILIPTPPPFQHLLVR